MLSTSFALVPTLVAGVAAFFLGGLWYGPLFGRRWSEGLGVDPAAIPPVAYGMGLVSYILVAGAVALIAGWAGAATALEGMVVGLVLWLGVAFALGLNLTFFTSRSRTAFSIEAGYQLVAFLVVGGIIGGWG